MVTPTRLFSCIPSKGFIVLVLSSIPVLFTPSNVRAESILSILRQPIVIDYAEDEKLCQSLIREETDPDDHFKTHYDLIPPVGVTEDSLFDYDQPPGEEKSWRYKRGRFDFDNDGITDLVFGVTVSNRSFNGDRYFVFPNTPKPGADLPEEEQPPYEPWPDNFGLEWLITQSRYVFPDVWGDCRSYSKYCGRDNLSHDTYTLRHQKSKNPTRYKFEELYSRPFRLRGVTYLLLSPIMLGTWGLCLDQNPIRQLKRLAFLDEKAVPKSVLCDPSDFPSCSSNKSQ